MSTEKYSTIEELAEEERRLLAEASTVHGEVFDTTLALLRLYNGFIASIDDPAKFIFVVFHGQIKKHLTLALFSAVRRHHVQAGMNMRQVYEASAWAAYALAHSDHTLFCKQEPDGTLSFPKGLERARNSWVEKNYPDASAVLVRLKKAVNHDAAHASLASASQTFGMRDASDPGFDTTFFDLEHRTQVQADIWLVGNVCVGLIILFHAINATEKVFRFNSAIETELRQRMAESDRQRQEVLKRRPSR